MIGVEFDTDKHAEDVEWECFTHGLLVLQAGHTVVRISPPLVLAVWAAAAAVAIEAAVASVTVPTLIIEVAVAANLT